MNELAVIKKKIKKSEILNSLGKYNKKLQSQCEHWFLI